MKHLIISFIISWALSIRMAFPQTVSHENNTALAATALHPYGRYSTDQQKNLQLISSAVHFGFSFTGSKCIVYASLDNVSAHSYLQYELDGAYQKRIRLNGNLSQPLVIDADDNGKHTVWIYKATEAHTGPVLIQKITGKNLHALESSDAALIEFIGNSITCGAASDTSEMPCGKGDYQDQHNAYYSYGPRVARALHVNFILSSVSGIGIYRNWNSDGPAMPSVYEKEDFQLKSTELWNFKKYSPKIVSIALGTNDFSHGDGIHPRLPFDSAAFVKNYVSFVQTVKSKYPKAKIALLSSPMVHGDDRTLLQNCLHAVKKQIDALYPADHPVALYFFLPMQAHGCSGHPSVEEHGVLAGELVPFFKNLLQ
jgi:lysophospholipase L1-like esterase